MDCHVATFHGSVYGKKVTRKESDLPADLINASAATRRVYEPTVSAAKLIATHKRSAQLSLQSCFIGLYVITCFSGWSSKPSKKISHKRISSSGDELQNQVDAGWVNVGVVLVSAATDSSPLDSLLSDLCRSTCP